MANQVVLTEYRLGIEKLDADLKHVEKGLSGIQDKADKSAKQVGESFKKSGSGANYFKSAIDDMGAKIAGAFAVEKVIEFGASCLAEFEQAERASMKLQFALGGNVQAFNELSAQADAIQGRLGIDNDDIKSYQAYAAAQGLSVDQTKELIEAALDFSARSGQDMQTTVQQLTATYEGSTGRLAKFDSRIRDLTQSQLANGDAVKLLGEKFKGFSDQIPESIKRIDQNKAALKDDMEAAGGFLSKVRDLFLFGPLNTLMGIANEKLEKMAEGFERNNAQVPKFVKMLGAMEKMPSVFKPHEPLVFSSNTEKAGQSLADLNDKLKIARENFEKASIGSADFIKYQKEMKRLQDQIDKASGKKNEDAKKAQDEALKKYQDHFNYKKKIEQDALDSEFEGMTSRWDAENEALEKNKQDEQDWADFIKDINESETASHLQAAKDQIEIDKKKAEDRKRLEDDVLQLSMQAADAIFEYRKAQRDAEQAELEHSFDNQYQALEEQKKKGEISDKAYQAKKDALDKEKAAKEKEARIKAAEADKEDALFRIAIQTAVAIAKTLAEFGLPAAWPFIAIAGAQGAIEAALVAAKPIPKYAKGTLDVQGGIEGRDSVHALLMPHEAVTPVDKARRFKLPLKAIHEGSFDKLYMPRIEAYEKAQGAGEKMWASMQMQRFNDRGIIEAIKGQKTVSLDKNTIKAIGSELRGSSKWKIYGE